MLPCLSRLSLHDAVPTSVREGDHSHIEEDHHYEDYYPAPDDETNQARICRLWSNSYLRTIVLERHHQTVAAFNRKTAEQLTIDDLLSLFGEYKEPKEQPGQPKRKPSHKKQSRGSGLGSEGPGLESGGSGLGGGITPLGKMQLKYRVAEDLLERLREERRDYPNDDSTNFEIISALIGNCQPLKRDLRNERRARFQEAMKRVVVKKQKVATPEPPPRTEPATQAEKVTEI